MTSYRQRLLRLPVLLDPRATKLHTETALAVNAILNGENDAVFESNVGPILKDANGHYWRLGITTAGALTTTDLGTDRP